MKYKRNQYRDFTLAHLLDQIIEYLKEEHKLPKSIYLPPEEYIYINYLMDSLKQGQITSYMGIPLKVNYEKQEISFSY